MQEIIHSVNSLVHILIIEMNKVKIFKCLRQVIKLSRSGKEVNQMRIQKLKNYCNMKSIIRTAKLRHCTAVLKQECPYVMERLNSQDWVNKWCREEKKVNHPEKKGNERDTDKIIDTSPQEKKSNVL